MKDRPGEPTPQPERPLNKVFWFLRGSQHTDQVLLVPTIALQGRKLNESLSSPSDYNTAQRSHGCSTSGDVHGQVGWDPGQSDLVAANPAHGRDWN